MSGRFRAAALVAVTAALLLGLTPPASADDHDLVVTVANPADSESSSVPVSGEVEFLLAEIDRVTVTLVPKGGGAPLGSVDACAPCGRPEDGKFRFSTTVPVAANGRYRVVASATGRAVAGLVDLSGTSPPSDGFGVAAPPRSPDDVETEVSPEGAVTVSWARNVEPDMLRYFVLRKDPGSDSYRPVGSPVEQPTSPRVTFSDPGPALVGGDFTYRVLAVRRGADPGSTVQSDPTTGEKVTIAAPPGAPAPGTGGGAAGFLTGGFPSARPNSTAGGSRSLEMPDTGFSDVLPFGARPPGEEMPEEPAEPRSLDVGTTTRTEFVSRGRPLVPVAGGAILLLLAIHLRLMNKRMAAASPALVAGRADDDPGTGDLLGSYGGGSRPLLRAQPAPEVEPPRYEEPAPAPDQLYDWAQLPDEELVEAIDDEWAGRDWDDYPADDDDEILESMVSPAR